MGVDVNYQMESLDGRYKNGNISLDKAEQLAHAGKMQGFKLYNQSGHFIDEYVLFDGKYRKVVGAKCLEIKL